MTDTVDLATRDGIGLRCTSDFDLRSTVAI
jgi:hypothetical protein